MDLVSRPIPIENIETIPKTDGTDTMAIHIPVLGGDQELPGSVSAGLCWHQRV